MNLGGHSTLTLLVILFRCTVKENMLKLIVLLVVLLVIQNAAAFSQEIDRFTWFTNGSCYPRNVFSERGIFCITEKSGYYNSLLPDIGATVCNCSVNPTILSAYYNLNTNSTPRDATFPLGVCIQLNTTWSTMYYANTIGGECNVLSPAQIARPVSHSLSAILSVSRALLSYCFFHWAVWHA